MPVPGPRIAVWPGGVRVSALGRVEGIEAVAEGSGGIVRDERVLPLPAGAVHRVVRVEIDQCAEAVRWGTVAGGAVAVDRRAAIGVAAEQILEAAVVDPVHAGLELRHRPGPVRDFEPVGTAGRVPRREAEVGQRLRPALRRPVGAVRRRARRDDVRERRPVVGAAAPVEGLPVERPVLAPAAGVVEADFTWREPVEPALEGSAFRAPQTSTCLTAPPLW